MRDLFKKIKDDRQFEFFSILGVLGVIGSAYLLDGFYVILSWIQKRWDLLLISIMFYYAISKLISKKLDGEILAKHSKAGQEILNNHAYSEDSKQIMHNLLKYNHLMVHKVRDQCYTDKNEIDKSEFIFKIYDIVTYNVRKLLIEHFKSIGCDIKDDIRITVKNIMSQDDVIALIGDKYELNKDINEIKNKTRWIVTVYRDKETYQNSRRESEVYNKVYDIESNTAYRKLFIKNNSRRNIRCFVKACPFNRESSCSATDYEYYCPVFANDDLASDERYENENEHWKATYNSTAIVPIRVMEKGKGIFIGALSVDSKNIEKIDMYNNPIVYEILAHASDLLALILLTLDEESLKCTSV